MTIRALTPSEVLEGFRSRGETVAAWARENGFGLQVVYSALEGRSKGHRGQAHRVAVALGMKPDPMRILPK